MLTVPGQGLCISDSCVRHHLEKETCAESVCMVQQTAGVPAELIYAELTYDLRKVSGRSSGTGNKAVKNAWSKRHWNPGFSASFTVAF